MNPNPPLHNTFSDLDAIHRIFEQQALERPGCPAVCCEGKILTYRELNEVSNRLAHYLKKLGVEQDTPVGLCFDRSLEMIIAILAVLKAGGAYVPVDLAYPRERLSFMLTDSRAPVLLTMESLAASLPEHGARTIHLDSHRATIGKESSENLPDEVKGANAAYIIYTSGSTGTPKGVTVTHHNTVRLFRATDAWFHFNSNDVWTLFHSYAFDFSVWEIWGALLFGGRLVVVPYLVSRSPSLFYDLLGQEGVTVLNQTPSAFRQLIWAEDSSQSKRPLKLRYVVFGGEALELQSLRPWFDRHGDETPQLVNMYGITETTVHVTYRVITKRDVENNLGSVIGVPIPDLQLYLLDEDLKPVPTEAPGEIFVGGEGVARGYLHRPELTESRFIADHISKKPGARLYRSGDLARFLNNGELEYLGRMDHQVKIRGFRIELGEIESALNKHQAVRESVVIAHETGIKGDKRLVAYLISKQKDKAPSISELREYLKEHIPEYMVPAVFLFLD
ncbi:MAG: amino acid adenylation enzyme/thioester reductase family protein [Verrucomicrobiales bacterium]|nr:amino acid adenylation enzyme/thioester reductase family protein [Verrucomicrobiales bacterium]